MSQDEDAPYHRAIWPRQTASAGSLSTTRSTASATVTTSVSATLMNQAAISTVSSGEDFDWGGDPCTAAIPAGGIIQFNDTYTLLLEEGASYVAQCSNQSIFGRNGGTSSNSTVLYDDPFYASIFPQMYVLGTSTVISYVLVILIFITPRTFYVNGPGGSTGATGSGGGLRALLPGSSGRGNAALGIGRRPLLQKIAALTVAVSLTIATVDTFRVAENQYVDNYIASKTLVQDVVNSTEIRVTRVISDTFLWLAQVQTLIRLFPRHKEKVTIKWLGFGLVLCDTVFSILENFVNPSHPNRPGTFTDAIPTLSYLFELSISLIYASCVLYYALSKRRFAFWHAKMRNVCLVALISIIAVLIPVVFFITDLAQPDIATWGEYLRWVGAAAASVVVWEWVERIEALERDERKDGILGREIFDGDEMLEMTPTEDGHGHSGSGRAEETMTKKSSQFWKNVRDLHIDFQPKLPLRNLRRRRRHDNEEKTVQTVDIGPTKPDQNQIARPAQAITPISRSDTNSVASTVYAVRYHDPFSPSPAIPEGVAVDQRRSSSVVNLPPAISDESTLTNSTTTTVDAKVESQIKSNQATSTGRQIWQGVANPFKRKRTEPPAEVAAQIVDANSMRSPAHGSSNLRNRFNNFTSAQRAKFVPRASKNKSPLAVTFIPAQPRISHLDPPAGDAYDDIEPSAPTIAIEEQTEDETDAESPNLATLPVTVVPPPVRGGRTWSPDDMDNEQSTPPAQQHEAPVFPSSARSASAVSGTRNTTPPVQIQRGTLTISESPGRIHDTHTPSNRTPSAMQRSRNNRSATIASIHDRLGSASPAAAPGSTGPRSATADSARPPRSATTDSNGRQPPA